jgi:hypothetical protein
MATTAATNLRSPIENSVLSFVIGVFANKVSMQKYIIIDSATAIVVHPKYIQKFNLLFFWPMVLYSLCTAKSVEASRSFSKIPMIITGSDVKRVLNVVRLQGSYKLVPVNPFRHWKRTWVKKKAVSFQSVPGRICTIGCSSTFCEPKEALVGIETVQSNNPNCGLLGNLLY